MPATGCSEPPWRALEPRHRSDESLGPLPRFREKGLRAKTKSAIDEFVAIPMADGVESLNLSVAAGVLMYELTGRSLAQSSSWLVISDS